MFSAASWMHNLHLRCFKLPSHPTFPAYNPRKDNPREKIWKGDMAKQLGFLVLFAPGDLVNLLLAVRNELG
jgi:hypothetical protein